MAKSMNATLRHLAALEAKLNPPVVKDDGSAHRRLMERYDEIAHRHREAGIPERKWTPKELDAFRAEFIAMMFERHGASPRG